RPPASTLFPYTTLFRSRRPQPVGVLTKDTQVNHRERLPARGERPLPNSDLPGADLAEPLSRLRELGVVRAALDLRGHPVGARIAAQETHLAADPVEARDRLAHPRAGHVTLEVEAEEVTPYARTGGRRLDAAQAHAAAL